MYTIYTNLHKRYYILTIISILQVLSTEAVVGIGVGAGVLVVVALVIAAVLLCARYVIRDSKGIFKLI